MCNDTIVLQTCRRTHTHNHRGGMFSLCVLHAAGPRPLRHSWFRVFQFVSSQRFWNKNSGLSRAIWVMLPEAPEGRWSSQVWEVDGGQPLPIYLQGLFAGVNLPFIACRTSYCQAHVLCVQEIFWLSNLKPQVFGVSRTDLQPNLTLLSVSRAKGVGWERCRHFFPQCMLAPRTRFGILNKVPEFQLQGGCRFSEAFFPRKAGWGNGGQPTESQSLTDITR